MNSGNILDICSYDKASNMERGTVTLILRYARVPEKPTAGSPEKEENSQLGTHHGFRVQPFILGKCTRYPETNG